MALAERAGIAEGFKAMAHVCLSPAVAAPLEAVARRRSSRPTRPNEASSIAALEQALAAPADD